MELTVLFLLLIALLVWFWTDSLRARERTLAVCKRTCKQLDVQLLDQTIALKSLTLARNEHGRLKFRRRYDFEFSVSGAERHRGNLSLLGLKLEFIRLEHPEGPLFINEGVKTSSS